MREHLKEAIAGAPRPDAGRAQGLQGAPFAFTGTLDKLTLDIDRPKLSPEDE